MGLSHLGQVELTENEKQLIEKINFEIAEKSSETSLHTAEELTKSLLARKAVPQIRIDYFVDPELNIGTKKSRQQVFESNGTRGDKIFRHPHFLKYLKYFIFGPDLPKQIINEFWIIREQNTTITSGDVYELMKLAKYFTKSHKLDPHFACEEFHKLALEIGISRLSARSLRDAVKKVR